MRKSLLKKTDGANHNVEQGHSLLGMKRRIETVNVISYNKQLFHYIISYSKMSFLETKS